MAANFKFRRKAVGTLAEEKGVYILADLDNIPLYVGLSDDTIKKRVQRHLTSARSDIIANRQLDVWEIAYVWEYPTENKTARKDLESILFHHFNPLSSLINGSIPPIPALHFDVPEPAKIVQVMSSEEIRERQQTEFRLPRQAQHYANLVEHFVAVKNSDQIARSMSAHFERLQKHHHLMQQSSVPEKNS